MTKEAKSPSPLQIGLLVVAVTWLLFTFHEIIKSMLNVNEYAAMPASPGATWVLITDYSGAVGLIARGVISLVAVVALAMYFTKRLSQSGAVKALRWLLVGEAIYWLSLFLSGVMGFLPLGYGQSGSISMGLLVETGIPCMVESLAIPAASIVLIYQLKPDKPAKAAINGAMILGLIYVFVFWLDNTSNWLYVAIYTPKGWSYVIAFPENVLNFALTTIGLLAVALYTAWFVKKSWNTESIQKLNHRAIGMIVTLVGLYYLWNYLTWIYFGNDKLWSYWFAWFLGHNLDLWALALPLIGLPLLLRDKSSQSEDSSG